MYNLFFSPAPSSLDGGRTDKLYGVRGETTKERRGRDSKSKGSIKSCRCVSRAQQRGRCQKRLPWDSIGEATRNGEEAISLICRVIKQILQFYPRKYINLARRPDVMQEKWVLARKINDQISRRFRRRHWSRGNREEEVYGFLRLNKDLENIMTMIKSMSRRSLWHTFKRVKIYNHVILMWIDWTSDKPC